jgi:hypothetical protein
MAGGNGCYKGDVGKSMVAGFWCTCIKVEGSGYESFVTSIFSICLWKELVDVQFHTLKKRNRLHCDEVQTPILFLGKVCCACINSINNPEYEFKSVAS